MAPPRPTEELRDPEKPSIDYRMGGYDHTDDPTADAKRQADVKRDAARKEQLKRAQADYQTLDFLESLTFIVIVTIFVIVDINLSMTRDTSKPAKSFQAFVTFFFLTYATHQLPVLGKSSPNCAMMRLGMMLCFLLTSTHEPPEVS